MTAAKHIGIETHPQTRRSACERKPAQMLTYQTLGQPSYQLRTICNTLGAYELPTVLTWGINMQSSPMTYHTPFQTHPMPHPTPYQVLPYTSITHSSLLHHLCIVELLHKHQGVGYHIPGPQHLALSDIEVVYLFIFL